MGVTCLSLLPISIISLPCASPARIAAMSPAGDIAKGGWWYRMPTLLGRADAASVCRYMRLHATAPSLRLQGGRGSDSGDFDDEGGEAGEGGGDTPENWSDSEGAYAIEGDDAGGGGGVGEGAEAEEEKAAPRRKTLLELPGGKTMTVDAKSLLTDTALDASDASDARPRDRGRRRQLSEEDLSFDSAELGGSEIDESNTRDFGERKKKTAAAAALGSQEKEKDEEVFMCTYRCVPNLLRYST
jgi:hypothetical protein